MSQDATKPSLPSFIDSTMMTTARACLKKFEYEYMHNFGPPGQKSVHLHAGGVFASSLEAFYRNVWEKQMSTDDALLRAHGAFIDAWGDYVVTDNTAKTKEGTWDAVQDYVTHYPPHIDHVQPLNKEKPSFEYTFAIPLSSPEFPVHPETGEPFIYAGRFDMLGKLVGADTVAIRDEKLQSRLTSNWSEQWNLRSQFLGYCWALQQAGIKCNTVVVRGIILTKTMIRHVEAVKVYPQILIDRWYDQLVRDLRRIVSAYNEGYFDYNLGDSCTSFGSTCMFMPLCSSPTPEAWYSTFSERKWNPLNKGNENE